MTSRRSLGSRRRSARSSGCALAALEVVVRQRMASCRSYPRAGQRYRNSRARIIGFPRGAGTKLGRYLDTVAVDAVGLDWTIELEFARSMIQKQRPVQGNLDPLALLAGGTISRTPQRAGFPAWHPAASHGVQTTRRQAPSGSRASGSGEPSRLCHSRGRSPRTCRGPGSAARPRCP